MIVAIALWMGCKDSEQAPTTFDDPLKATLVGMDGDDASLAPAVRALEAQIYQTMPVASADVVARSLIPAGISEQDVATLEPRPDRDPQGCLTMAVATLSEFSVEDHAVIPILEDQRPLEPTSPDHYDRTFLEGEACWGDRSCAWLRTHQELTKVYTLGILPPLTYQMFKDFRWVDLATGTDDPPRWAVVARSWDDDSYSSENGKTTVWQSYTLELWIPRDGAGFLHDAPAEDDFADSSGPGTLRFLVLWTETETSATDSEDLQQGTIRWGMDQNLKAQEKWLSQQAKD